MCTLLLLGNLLLSQNIGNSVWMCGRQAANTTVLAIYLMSTSHLGILALLSARTAVGWSWNWPRIILFCVRKMRRMSRKNREDATLSRHKLISFTDPKCEFRGKNILLHVFFYIRFCLRSCLLTPICEIFLYFYFNYFLFAKLDKWR